MPEFAASRYHLFTLSGNADFFAVTFFGFPTHTSERAKKVREIEKTEKIKNKLEEKMKMKKLAVKFFIAVLMLTGIPGFGHAATNSMIEVPAAGAAGYYNRFRLPGRTVQTHRIYLNAGRGRIQISGDGDTDLDLYVYDGNGLIGKAESRGDDEVIPLTVYRSGYFTVKVINRGNIFNDYTLIVQ